MKIRWIDKEYTVRQVEVWSFSIHCREHTHYPDDVCVYCYIRYIDWIMQKEINNIVYSGGNIWIMKKEVVI
jgi:hypothetical protein